MEFGSALMAAIVSVLIKYICLWTISLQEYSGLFYILLIYALAKFNYPSTRKWSSIISFVILSATPSNSNFEVEYLFLAFVLAIKHRKLILKDKEYYLTLWSLISILSGVNVSASEILQKFLFQGKVFLLCCFYENSTNYQISTTYSFSASRNWPKGNFSTSPKQLNWEFCRLYQLSIESQLESNYLERKLYDVVDMKIGKSKWLPSDLKVHYENVISYEAEFRSEKPEKSGVRNQSLNLLSNLIMNMNIGCMIVDAYCGEVVLSNSYANKVLNFQEKSGRKLKQYIKLMDSGINQFNEEASLYSDCFKSSAEAITSKYVSEETNEIIYVYIEACNATKVCTNEFRRNPTIKQSCLDIYKRLNPEEDDPKATKDIIIDFIHKRNSLFASASTKEINENPHQYKIVLIEKSDAKGFQSIKHKIYDNIRSKFLITISHELNNPLSGLKFNVDSIMKTDHYKKEGAAIKFYSKYIGFFVKMLSFQLKLSFNEIIVSDVSLFSLSTAIVKCVNSFKMLFYSHKLTIRYSNNDELFSLFVLYDYQFFKLIIKSIFVFIKNVVPRKSEVIISLKEYKSSNPITQRKALNDGTQGEYKLRFEVTNLADNLQSYDNFSSSWNSNIQDDLKISNSVATADILETFLQNFSKHLRLKFEIKKTDDNYLQYVELNLLGQIGTKVKSKCSDKSVLQARLCQKSKFVNHLKLDSGHSINAKTLKTSILKMSNGLLSTTQDINSNCIYFDKSQSNSPEASPKSKNKNNQGSPNRIFKKDYLIRRLSTNRITYLSDKCKSNNNSEQCYTEDSIDLNEIPDANNYKVQTINKYDFDKTISGSNMIKLHNKQNSILTKFLNSLEDPPTTIRESSNSNNSIRKRRKERFETFNPANEIQAHNDFSPNPEFPRIDNSNGSSNLQSNPRANQQDRPTNEINNISILHLHTLISNANEFERDDRSNKGFKAVEQQSNKQLIFKFSDDDNDTKSTIKTNLKINKHTRKNFQTDKYCVPNVKTSSNSLFSKISEISCEQKHKELHVCNTMEFLVVDDELSNRKSLLNHLKSMGYNAREAINGLNCINDVRETLTCLNCTKFSLIFLDLHMPIMDGLECAKNLEILYKGREDTHPKILVVSAHEASVIREMIKNLPMINGFMTKPVYKGTFQKVVASILSI